MRIRLIAVGKLREAYTAAACADFRKRLAPYFAYDEVEVRAANGRNRDEAMREEAAAVLRLVRESEPLWLLERSGTMLASEEVAQRLGAVQQSGASRLCVVVAGTYGADPTLRERADVLWSLSRLTFLHEWARMIVLEQLYRAAKIASNEPYHH